MFLLLLGYICRRYDVGVFLKQNTNIYAIDEHTQVHEILNDTNN